MKTLRISTFLYLFSLLFLFSKDSQAQVDITINPIGAVFGNFTVGTDFAITPNISVDGVVGVNSKINDGEKSLVIPITAFGKYYFLPKSANDRFYTSVFLQFVNINEEYRNDNFSYEKSTRNRFGVGFGVGYKILSAGGFLFDIGLGMGRTLVNTTNSDVHNNTRTLLYHGSVMLTGKFSVGYRFGKK